MAQNTDDFKKNIAGSEGNQLVVGAFHVLMDKIEADMLQIAKKQN